MPFPLIVLFTAPSMLWCGVCLCVWCWATPLTWPWILPLNSLAEPAMRSDAGRSGAWCVCRSALLQCTIRPLGSSCGWMHLVTLEHCLMVQREKKRLVATYSEWSIVQELCCISFWFNYCSNIWKIAQWITVFAWGRVPSHASVQISVWFFVVITAFSRNIALRKRSLNMGCMLSRGVIRTHVEKQRAVISMSQLVLKSE
jgi:hypothetical protein